MKDSCISNLLTNSKRYRALGWSTIPVDCNKQPDIPSVVPLRNILPSDIILDRYFGINKKPTTVGLAVLLDTGKFMIDTDGAGEEIFITKVMPRLNPELKEKFKRTTHTKSPHGRHFLGKLTRRSSGSGNGNENGKSKKNEFTWSFVHNNNGKGHDEIKIRLYGFYSIEYGEGYEEVTAIENAQDFTDVEIEETVGATNEVSKEINVIRTITGLIAPFYIRGNRDEINFSLSGFLHKGGVPEQLITDIIDPLIDKQNTVEPTKTYDVIRRTCNKPADTDQVSGYERLLAAVNNDKNVVLEIQQVLCDLGNGKYFQFSNSNPGSSNNKESRRHEREARKKKENEEKDDYTNKLISEYNIKTLTDTREIWLYDKDRGIFVKNGDTIIEKGIESDYPHIQNKQISEYLGHIKRRTFTDRSGFDNNIEWLACNNCMLNLKTGEIADFNPHFMCTIKIPVRYPIECASGFIADFFRLVEEDNTTICPKPRPQKIMRFLHEIMSDKDVEIIIDFLAYCLWRDYRFNTWILLNGKGNNGKSTLLKLLTQFLGWENMSSESLYRLVKNDFAPANLYQKLINLDADLTSDTLGKSTGTLKKLTGGDELAVEEKYKKAFSFTNYAKLIFSCNTIPKTDDETDAFFRRLIIINFT